MAELTNTEIDAALARGRIAHEAEPRAAHARYDRKRGRIVVDLTNGATFAFPPRLAEGLEAATDNQLAEVEILGHGFGLHWESLDVDLSIPGLLTGIFGTRSYMARFAGRTKSPAKARTARRAGGRARRHVLTRRRVRVR